MSLFHHISCIATVDGVLLEWELKDECTPRSFQVFANYIDRKVIINSSLLYTGRCYIKSDFAGLVNNYKVRVTLVTGESEESPELRPQILSKEARLLLNEIHRRELVHINSHPFGKLDCTLFLKNQYGVDCPLCGSTIGAGVGGPTVDPGCPLCIGTGVKDPYYMYPRKEPMLIMPPKDDKITGAPGVLRNIVTTSLRTVSPLYLREDDIIMSMNEAYIVKSQEVVASVGNTPAVYVLSCVQLPTGEPRYNVLRELSTRETSNGASNV